MSDTTLVIFAFLGGAVPALLWLWFWLREDTANPEPKSLLAETFIAGLLMVPLVIWLEQQTYAFFQGFNLTFSWVAIEETAKYAAALLVVLWRRAVDEPIDMLVYMITAALGFAALENALFIFNPLEDGDLTQSLITGHFRFLGATLIHVLGSATVGLSLALAFYRPWGVRLLYSVAGLALAIVLHALFNFFIMGGSGEKVLAVFLFVWIGIIGLLVLFEKVKQLRRV